MWFSRLYGNNTDKPVTIEEFRGIFQELFPELCLYATKFVGDFDTSKDLVHDVFADFWTNSEKLKNKSLVKPYLYKAVKNRALNYNKREKRKSRLDELFDSQNVIVDFSDNNDIISAISYEDLQADLEEAIGKMPEQRQAIFRMSRFQQMKHKEIAEELNISPKTVETQIYRSLIFLRSKLSHYLNDR
ncbi:RNA polymerase sigma-70 factor, ECF subfamily [Mariniphaga anaerophila]|uniref:RNA polymerase sigma-70 factor, ECF subfamily n=1 Tax=Mariniphaga anaerophila TaxID=1484053 RepID=A0A1M4XJV6_9BACT|nr:RNA polymerase sigma-70 factor [Mariniphaga anaerophila]SHE93937.1 RNA polymerase sigma-70 factor, ECF subfamily [Mariniphaga anaerophila]